jgi:hypothetical protein
MRAVGHCIELVGYKGFEVGPERFIGLLNHLHVDFRFSYIPEVLLETAQSHERHQHLAIQSWESLVWSIVVLPEPFSNTVYTPHVTSSLLGSQEWNKLECWMGIVWVLWPPETEDVAEDLKHAMKSLFCQQPSAVHKLTRWVKRGWKEQWMDPPKSFQLMCKQAHEAAL